MKLLNGKFWGVSDCTFSLIIGMLTGAAVMALIAAILGCG